MSVCERTGFLSCLAVVVLFATYVHAQQTFTGQVGGTYEFYDEDVYFVGEVELISDLTVTVYNGSIYVNATLITGRGADGANGQDGFYEGSPPFAEHPPVAGDDGQTGKNLTLRTLPFGGGSSSLDIYLASSYIDLSGGDGGRGGSGSYGYIPWDGCPIELLPQGPAVAGAGGNGGALTVNAGGDVYWYGQFVATGGKGGRGGAGGGIAVGSTGIYYELCAGTGWGGGQGAPGGRGGSITIEAMSGSIFCETAPITAYLYGGEGGDGGAGGGNASPNGLGGSGGRGGAGGSVDLYALGIEASTLVKFFVYGEKGGDGGPGGNGGGEDGGCGCTGFGSTDRDRGVQGGFAGRGGDGGTARIRTPQDVGAISLPGVQVIASSSTTSGASGGTGSSGFAWVYDDPFCQWNSKTPLPGVAGTLGGRGGEIYFETASLQIPNCLLDARGGKGARGGMGGNSESGWGACEYVSGAPGGPGGHGGPGGAVYLNVSVVDGSGGQVTVCGGAGGQGGDGGCPGGVGRPGGRSGFKGTFESTASSGVLPGEASCPFTTAPAGSSCPP